MNAYLVMMRFGMDDIPLLLTSDKAAAIAYAEQCTPESANATQDVLGTDASESLYVDVYEFTNGKLTNSEQIKDFTRA